MVPFLFLWLLWQARRAPGLPDRSTLRQRLTAAGTGMAATLAVMALLIAPWTVHNYQAFGRFVLLNTNAGFALYWGNHPLHGTQFVPVFHSVVYYEMVPHELRELDEASKDAALLKLAVEIIRDDPGRYALLSLSRAREYFEFLPSGDSGLLSNAVRLLSFGVYLPFMLAGLVLAAVRLRTSGTAARQGALLLALFAGSYSLIHLLSWALIRYRLPVDAVLTPFAALALVELVAAVGRRIPRDAPDLRLSQMAREEGAWS
jgi:hypothetical protein